MEHRTFICSGTILHHTIMVDTSHYTFVKTLRLHNTQQALSGKLLIWGESDMLMYVDLL